MHGPYEPDEGLRRCLPPRLPNEAGESCALPLASRPQGGDVVVNEQVFFGAAIDDCDIVCGAGGQPDVVIGFTLVARAGDEPETPQGISIRADNGVAVTGGRDSGCGHAWHHRHFKRVFSSRVMPRVTAMPSIDSSANAKRGIALSTIR